VIAKVHSLAWSFSKSSPPALSQAAMTSVVTGVREDGSDLEVALPMNIANLSVRGKKKKKKKIEKKKKHFRPQSDAFLCNM
jgi:hypothetical protein